MHFGMYLVHFLQGLIKVDRGSTSNFSKKYFQNLTVVSIIMIYRNRKYWSKIYYEECVSVQTVNFFMNWREYCLVST
jgi:hypothetical protein